MKYWILVTSLVVTSMMTTTLSAQVGIGLLGGIDLYQRYTNPADGIASPSAGNAIANIVFGPKIWVGGKKLSLSAEVPATIGLTGFSSKDYKGLGLAAVPVIGMVNFLGNSGLDRDAGPGFGLGGGIMQYRTELYGLTDDFISQGVTRDWEQVFVVQAEVGFGITGWTGKLYARYGFSNDDEELRTFNIGILADFNFIMMRRIKDPASAL